MNEKTVKITKQVHALKGYVSSYNVEISKSINPEQQLKDTESATERKLKQLLSELRGFKLVTTPALVLKNIESEDKTKYDTFYLHSKAERIINESDIDDVFKSIYTTIISNIHKIFRKSFRLDY